MMLVSGTDFYDQSDTKCTGLSHCVLPSEVFKPRRQQSDMISNAHFTPDLSEA